MIYLTLEKRLREAVAALLPDASLAAVQVRPCPDPKFGDYQTASLMALAKERRMNPRQLATDALARLDVSDCCEKVEIAGAGFLNFRLKPAAFSHSLAGAARGEIQWRAGTARMVNPPSSRDSPATTSMIRELDLAPRRWPRPRGTTIVGLPGRASIDSGS